MSINQSEPNAGGLNPDGNLSAGQLIAGLAQTLESPADEQEEIQSEEVEEIETEQSEEIESETEEEEESEQEEGEENQGIDLASLSLEGLQTLIAGPGQKSRLLKRIAELTAKNKAHEERERSQPEAKPLPKPIADNPFASLKTRAEVEAKIELMEKVAEDTDRILDDHEDYGSNDIINIGDKEYTKKDIKAANRNARNALSKLLPAQLTEIARSEQGEQAREHLNALIPVQIPELADEESPLSLKFKASKEDPVYQELRATAAGPQIDYLLAHALRSIHSFDQKKKLAPTVPGEKPKPKVAGNPVGTASRPIAQSGKGREQLETFEKTGNAQDLVRLLS